MSELCVYTTGNEDKLALTRQSCTDVGITLQTYDCKWIDYIHVKVKSALMFLQNVKEPVVMWVDGNDSLVLQPERVILYKWAAMGNPLLISAEKSCWPDADLETAYKLLREPILDYPSYVNAGGFIGYKDQVMTALHTIMLDAGSYRGDDQRAWTALYLSQRVPLQIDHLRYLFASVGDGNESLVSDSCARHWNGKVPGREEYYAELSKERA